MPYVNKHIRNKMKYNSIVKFIKSKTKNVTPAMEHILTKHRMYRLNGEHNGDGTPKRIYDMDRIGRYVVVKMSKYGFKQYPSYTLLVMDDFAGHPLLKQVDSPLNRSLTKTRHYHLTAILAIQTWRFVSYNFKRLCTDIVIWKGFDQETFMNMIKQTPCTEHWESLWDKYKNLVDPHSYLVINITASSYAFNGN